MSIEEIKDADDAKSRIERLFNAEEIGGERIAKLAQLLDLLSNPQQKTEFENGLRDLSKAIWVNYNAEGIKDKTNRFTSSIIKAGESLGFACQDNVVFVGALEGAAFGANLRGHVLWKDSFALDHGEFSHSYQWLVAGRKFNWQTGTATLYGELADMRSSVPLFVIDNGKLAFRRAPMWEYLVDCTNYSEGKCAGGERARAVQEYLDRQFAQLRDGKAVDPYFANEFLRKHYKDDFFEADGKKWKPEFNSAANRAGKKLQIAAILDDTPRRAEQRTFIEGEVGRFATQNAITRGFGEGGTFRSPNNVTYLVRRESTWFINAYQIHRSGRRPPFNAHDYPELDGEESKTAKGGRLGERAAIGVAKLEKKFGKMSVERLDRDRRPMVGRASAPSKREMQSGTVNHVKDREGNLITTDLPPVTKTFGARQESFATTNPIEGTRYAQHKRFQAKPGYAETDANVYVRAQDGRAATTKGQDEQVFHGVPGFVNTSLKSSIALNK